MESIDLPLSLDFQVPVEVSEEVLGGHDSPREEMASHPIIRRNRFKGVRHRSVAKDVNEEFAIGGKPLFHPGKELAVISQMFQHLHGDNSIESLLDGEIVHIPRFDLNSLKPSFSRLGQDELSLCG